MKLLTVITILSVVVAACASTDPAGTSTTAAQTTAPSDTGAPPESGEGTTSTAVESGGILPDLTDAYGCGFGFFVGSPDQRAGLFVNYQDVDGAFNGDVESTSEIADGLWAAEVRVGNDLFANWCDDVVEPGEPEPEVLEKWVVTTGAVTIGDLPGEAACGPVSGDLTGFVAVTADGTKVTLPDMRITNEAWGCFAG